MAISRDFEVNGQTWPDAYWKVTAVEIRARDIQKYRTVEKDGRKAKGVYIETQERVAISVTIWADQEERTAAMTSGSAGGAPIIIGWTIYDDRPESVEAVKVDASISAGYRILGQLLTGSDA